MKSFLNEYGFAILSTIVVIMIILMISPVGISIRHGLFDLVLKFTDSTSAGMEQLDNTLSSLGDDTVVDNGHYLTFSSPDGPFTVSLNGTSIWNDGNIEYSLDKKTWTALDDRTIYNTINSDGGNIYLRGWGNSNVTFKFDLTGSNISCTGNLENLVDYKVVADGGHPNLALYAFDNSFAHETELVEAPEILFDYIPTYAFNYAFYGCTNLVKGPSVISASAIDYAGFQRAFEGCTKLKNIPKIETSNPGEYAFYSMFKDCTRLEKIPDDNYVFNNTGDYALAYMFFGCDSLSNVPNAIVVNGTMGQGLFSYMFQSCDSLATMPMLPTVNLSQYCYQGMFKDCASLVNTQFLIAPSVPSYAYANMFQGCTSLVASPNILATSLSDSACYQMFADCTSLKGIPSFNNFGEITIAGDPFLYMYQNCSQIKLSTTYSSEYSVFFWVNVNNPPREYSYNTFVGTGGVEKGNMRYKTNYFFAPDICIVNSSTPCK